MSHSETDSIDTSANILDSRDVLARLEYLRGLKDELNDCKADRDGCKENKDEQGYILALQSVIIAEGEFGSDEREELAMLEKIADEIESAASEGEAFIAESYFTDYCKELVDDCYQMPKEFDSGNWPWRHMTMDWEAAADEAKQDYSEIELGGNTFLYRNC